jgi:2-methylisocitrate lyase-like PEP mutase family enzyme
MSVPSAVTRSAALRALIGAPGIIVAPGAYDAWSAKVIEQAGFPITYVGAGNVTAGLMGAVDVSWMTLTEMVEHTAHIVRATTTPVVVDVDTGYGNAINVIRTIQLYEGIGVSGVHIEDQVLPKRCGHFDNHQVIDEREMVRKIEAARNTCRDDGFVIIARTDAIEPLGVEAAIARANTYLSAGADMIFVEAPTTLDDLRRIPAEVRGPCMVNVVEGGKTPQLSTAEYEAMGYKLVIFPGTCLKTAAWAMRRAMRELYATGTTLGLAETMLTFDERQALTGLPEILALEAHYLRSLEDQPSR